MTKTRDQRPALTQDQTLQRAVNHHKAGQLQEAERLYRVILQAQPQHPEANHNMGMIALQVKQPAAGLPYFKTALEANPNQRQYWVSYINALIQTGQTDDAKKVLAQGRQRGLRGEAVDALTGRLNGPSSDEINSLVALFNRGRYAEGEALAHRLTVHFPQVGFAWKALGLMLKMQGRSAEALVPMQKAAALLPIDAEAHSNLGNTLQEQGRLTEAEASHRRALEIRPDFTEAHYNLGNTLQEQGRLMEAEATYCRALELNPNFAEAHNNLGNTLQEQGQLTEAEACYHRALEIMPEYAVARNNLGNTLRDQGRITDSEASYRMALAIKPEYAEAHSNLGNTLADQGRLTEAEASYRRALEIMPEYAEAHSNLGNTLREQDRLSEAEASYRQALASKPDYVEALNNLALLLNAQGEYMMALSNIKQSLQIKETGEAKKIFVNCVKRLCWTHDDSKISIAMVRALSEPWGRPSDLARISADIIKLNRDIGGCVARASDAWPLRLSTQDLYRSNGLTILAANPLLYALLDSTAICDIEMERLLTMARSAMLDAATGMTASGGEVATVLSFYSALARQCFINEYVFSYTDDEIQRASNLRDSLVAALETNTQVPVLWLIAVASYFPLCSLPLAARLLDFQWPEAVTVLLVQQLREPEEELQLRTTIPRLTNIEDEVSLLVQNQYEENPYPRWVKAEPAEKAMNIVGYLCQKFPLSSFERHDKIDSIDVLIAGCGTGQHSIRTAQRLRGAQVMAVDLSISSLSYAKRKTQELGLTSIEYAQADLLKLGSLGRSFTVIESVGVLHHLADPWTGWKVLLSLLRPRGFMKLGLYSKVARRNIIRIHNLIAEHGYGSSAEDIRQCRQDLINLDKNEDFGNILELIDFFSISTCRDFLFHVQEQNLTLNGIEAFLRENNLVFLGFEIDLSVLLAYKRRFPNDRAATNLAQWQIYENENPDTFLGMYQFWIQKIG